MKYEILTPHQERILKFRLNGDTAKEIAGRLRVSASTIKQTMEIIRKKLKIDTIENQLRNAYGNYQVERNEMKTEEIET